MSSQLPMGEVPATQVPGTETTRGWVRRPSEKVQAMLGGFATILFTPSRLLTRLAEEHEHSKHASMQQAREKAKRRETLARKRKQAGKAAETDPFMAATLKAPTRGYTSSPVNVDLDPAVCTLALTDKCLTIS
ncbi:hypothetical protein JVT61DRAFT_12455 [Boletus reticuloceps]|uniref:Uncharacterized protein n=1 Tax=Boletus reticuloceps TaxID=495285 RepID=A0A8I3A445_9AGAM|nr:hypothetical protein JVT61DRAFT_12455 [Boletus reticuloceps]